MRLESLNANVDSYDEDLAKASKNLNKNDTTLALIEKDESTIIILPIENSTSLSNDHDIIIKENRKNNEFKHKEGGWGWIVLLCVIWSYGLAVSWYTNFNLIIPYFINYYNQTEHYTVFYSGKFFVFKTFIEKYLLRSIFNIKNGLDRFHLVLLCF
jgi:hypothetical protein